MTRCFELGRQRVARSINRIEDGVEGEHAYGVAGDAEREPPVAEPSSRMRRRRKRRAAAGGEVCAFGVEDGAISLTSPGLYAFRVVPRAPNFCALRRVSSNFERA